jgi:UDP-2,4-diacetamido-2,4,6-trideoxy-beta-L-altropyranose hydrolase
MGSGVSTRANSTRGVGGTHAKRVTLRPATPEDCRQVWLWRNDEGTRAASFDTSPISFETHERWFHESLRHRDRHVYIVLVDGQEAGVVRLDVAGARGIVNIHLAPEWRGRGVGPRTLAALEDVAFGPLHLTRMEAEVKAGNAASLAAFQKVGFTLVGGESVLNLVKVRREA